LGIDLSQNKQGGYVKYYVSVSGDNYLENATGNRKEITVLGAAIPEFAPYNLGADPQYNTPKKQMAYLATHNYDDADGHVYGGRFQWGREWDDTDNTTSYPIKVDDGITKYQLWKDANHVTVWSSSILYNSAGQITDATTKGYHVNGTSGSSDDWHYPQNDTLWGNGKGVGATYDMADLDYAAGTGVKYTNDKWFQSPQTPAQYANNDPCKKMNGVNDKSWRLPTQDEWERLANYDCDPSSAATATRITGITTTAAGVGKAYTWVPVNCKNGTCVPCIDWTSTGGYNSGYAVYKTSDLSGVTLNATVDLLTLAQAPVLFLPAAGYRSYTLGGLNFVGNYGLYWSSGVDGTHGRLLTFYRTYVNPTPGSDNNRAYGFSVRCVADSTNY
jgi:hypothetical protein